MKKSLIALAVLAAAGAASATDVSMMNLNSGDDITGDRTREKLKTRGQTLTVNDGFNSFGGGASSPGQKPSTNPHIIGDDITGVSPIRATGLGGEDRVGSEFGGRDAKAAHLNYSPTQSNFVAASR